MSACLGRGPFQGEPNMSHFIHAPGPAACRRPPSEPVIVVPGARVCPRVPRLPVTSVDGRFPDRTGNVALADVARTVPDAVAGNLASLAEGGNPADSGISSDAVSRAITEAGTAYQKPEDGVPKADLSEGVRTSLDLAAAAVQPGDILTGDGDNKKIKSSLLPSYVDDVVEFDYKSFPTSGVPAFSDAVAYQIGDKVTYGSPAKIYVFTEAHAAGAWMGEDVRLATEFPADGEEGKIYVTLDTNKTYRWGGTAYVEISNPDLTEYAKRAELFPAWAANTAYTTYSIVIHENAIYRCTTAHTSGAEWDSTKWAVAPGAEVLAMIRDYTAQSNKPSINGATLTGNKTAADLGLASTADATLTEAKSYPALATYTLPDTALPVTYNGTPPPGWDAAAISLTYDAEDEIVVLDVGSYVAGSFDPVTGVFKTGDSDLRFAGNMPLRGEFPIVDIALGSGYVLGSQTTKPVASEAEAEALRAGKLDKSAVVSPSSSATAGQAADAKATGDVIEPLLFAQYYPDGSVKSAAEFTTGIKYDAPDTVNRTITVKPFCNTGDSADDNSGLVGRVVIPPFVDAQGNPYISDDGTRYKVVGVSDGSSLSANTNLTTIVAPNTVMNIGVYAFDGCASLTSVSLPAATSINVSAFVGCASLASVSLPAVQSIESGTFDGCASLVSVSLPAAQSIRDGAFNNCSSLTTVSCPSAQGIEVYAFNGCTSLSSVDFGDTPRSSVPTLGAYAFYDVPTSCKIIVPDAQYDAWTAATNWSDLVTAGYKFLRHSEWEYARKYELAALLLKFAPEWASGSTYKQYNLVQHSGTLYYKKSSGESSQTGIPGTDTTNWHSFSSLSDLTQLFLPLTGGTMTGPLVVRDELTLGHENGGSPTGVLWFYGSLTGSPGLIGIRATTDGHVQLLSKYNDVIAPVGTFALLKNIAPNFSTASTYALNALCVYEGVLYFCTTAVTTAGAWTGSSNWMKATVEDVLAALRTAIAAKQDALSAQQLDNIAAVPNKANASDIPYSLGTPTVIDTASSETVEGETVYYGAATLANRTANIVQVTAATALDELRITFPAATSGKVRDFGLRVEIGTGSAALTAPALVPVSPTGETIKIENSAKEIPALADGTATAKGVTLLYFSETAPGVFVVKGEQVEEVA